MNICGWLNLRRRKVHRVSGRRRQPNAAVTFELLEPRTLLAANIAWPLPGSPDWEAATTITASQLGAGVVRVADAGSTFGTADDLGELSGDQTFYGSVGGRDTADVLRFSLAADSKLTIQLGELRSDIDLALYDSSGQRIGFSNKAGRASESISLTLESGTYYVAVTPWGRASSTYVLATSVAFTSSPPTDPTPPSDPVTVFPDVSYYGGSNDWNLNAINAPESWAQGDTGSGVTVSVVDTGVDLDHADLVNQIWVNPGEVPGNGVDDDHNGYVDDVHGWDFVSNDNWPDDGNGHGTHVAGTIAAERNSFGATGVAPGATIMPVRVLNSNGYGTDYGVAAGIRYAAQNGADIINLSLGGTFSTIIQSAIRFAQQLDVLVVAAAGNESAAAPSYPARFSASMSNVISVGAHAISNTMAGFSNRAGSSGAVQVDAPGVGVYSTYPAGHYATLSGTSMAAPHVAGLAALALSADSNLTANQLRSLIVEGANRMIAGSDSSGGINAAVTVALAAAGQATSVAASSAITPAVFAQPFFVSWSIVTTAVSSGDGVVQTGSLRSVASTPAAGVPRATIASSATPASSPSVHDEALLALMVAHNTSAVASGDVGSSARDLLAASEFGLSHRATRLTDAWNEGWAASDTVIDAALPLIVG